MNENESILYIKIKLGKRSICVKYAIRFLSVAAFFLMIEQTSFFITRHAAKNMLADKEQKEIYSPESSSVSSPGSPLAKFFRINASTSLSR